MRARCDMRWPMKSPGLAVWILLATILAGGCAPMGQIRAADPPDTGRTNWRIPTTGGKQFWSDELFFHHWRIQRNVLTGHCRLLDPEDVRQAWGTYAQCHTALEETKRQHNLPPMSGKAVILLHGLMRSRAAMDKLARHLAQEGGYIVLNVSYPTTRQAVAQHAKALDRVVRRLEGIEEINFVAHSMGNIVVRHYLHDQTDPATGRQGDPRIRRFVMIAPPNHGSRMATELVGDGPLNLIIGEPGKELGIDWKKLERPLATPKCQFGIIAGGKGDGKGFNPLLTGDNDMVITTATARLAGARDYIVAPGTHTFLMDRKDVQGYVLTFLNQGHFVSEARRKPIASDGTK